MQLLKKYEKQYIKLLLYIPRIQGVFSDRIARDIIGFTDEPVVQYQYDVQVLKNTFVDDSEQMIKW